MLSLSQKKMSIKVIVTAIGQHVIADIKQIENKETNELVGYWLENPRMVIVRSKTQIMSALVL